MPTTLRDALSEMLDGWKDDLPSGWRSALNDITTDASSVDASLRHHAWEPIFPVRKGEHFPGARKDGHIFRAFDGLAPNEVKVVVLGQDPYPNPAQATGRAFEQGDLDRWPMDSRFVALSLRRILQAAAYAKTGRGRYIESDARWETVVKDIESGALKFRQRPARQFDAWQKQGVMFLNTGLTLSRFDRNYQFDGHLPFWQPVVTAVMRHLSTTDTPIVFLLWGTKARTAFVEAGVLAAAQDAGTWKNKVDEVTNAHPAWPREGVADIDFFKAERNPFLLANQKLKTMGAKGINW